MPEPSPWFQGYADWLKWRAGRFTAGPPQLLSQYGIQLEDWRIKPAATLYGLAEITGIPTLIRWGQAILQNRPIAEVEEEYFSRIAKELQQAGINVDENTLRTRVEQATAYAALTALPLAAPLSRQELAALAKSLGIGFGFVGAPTAFIRTAQGHPDEALKAFIETGLAGTVLTDAALVLKNLAADLAPERLAAISRQIAQQQRRLAGWRDPEGEAFINQINEALLALKRGDTSKYDQLLRQFEEWQAKIDEFRKLYEAKQKGQLTPEDEARYTKLLKEVSEIRDKYELLKQYIDAAREMGLEARARPGVDEQTFTEHAVLMLRERQWENLANMPDSELKKILMDEALLKKHASEFGMSEEAFKAKLEELLQQRMGVKPPEAQPTSEKPPIEPIKQPEAKPPEAQFRPPEAEVETRGGQVLVVRAEGGLKPLVNRLDDLPTVQARLQYLLRRRRRLDEEAVHDWNRLREEVTGGRRGSREEARREDTARTTDETPNKTRDDTPGKTTDETPNKTTDETPNKTVDETPTKTVDRTVVTERVTVVDRNTLRMFIPLLPASVFAMPAAVVLPLLSRVVGAPLALAPDIPRPLPRESFANWLDRVFAGTGFTWRSLAAQREAFVFA